MDSVRCSYPIHNKPNGSRPATILIGVSPVIVNIGYVIAKNGN